MDSITTTSSVFPVEGSRRGSVESSSSSFFSSHRMFQGQGGSQRQPPPQRQMMLCGNQISPNASQVADIAAADFLISCGLPFSLSEDPKFKRIFEVGRNLGPNYKPPDRGAVSGRLMDSLFKTARDEQLHSLRQEADQFGLSIFGDGATIQKVPLINILAASPNNPFALLDIVDCTSHLAGGGKKDAPYISNLILPLIKMIEGKAENDHSKKKPGLVDLVLFDGASNVVKAGKLLAINYPRITALHGAEHVVSLFFRDVYTQVS